jgi:hypothetical protein
MCDDGGSSFIIVDIAGLFIVGLQIKSAGRKKRFMIRIKIEEWDGF